MDYSKRAIKLLLKVTGIINFKKIPDEAPILLINKIKCKLILVQKGYRSPTNLIDNFRSTNGVEGYIQLSELIASCILYFDHLRDKHPQLSDYSLKLSKKS